MGRTRRSRAIERILSDPLIRKYFYKKVDKTPGHGPWGNCWIWVGSTPYGTYGRFGVNIGDHVVVVFGAHQVSWIIDRKKRIPKGKEICHSCDITYCINPVHLYAAKHSTNIKHCVERGRHGSKTMPENVASGSHHGSAIWPEKVVRGESHPNSKLTEKQVIVILKLLSKRKLSQLKIAKCFKVGQSTISYINQRKLWSHL